MSAGLERTPTRTSCCCCREREVNVLERDKAGETREGPGTFELSAPDSSSPLSSFLAFPCSGPVLSEEVASVPPSAWPPDPTLWTPEPDGLGTSSESAKN